MLEVGKLKMTGRGRQCPKIVIAWLWVGMGKFLLYIYQIFVSVFFCQTVISSWEFWTDLSFVATYKYIFVLGLKAQGFMYSGFQESEDLDPLASFS